MSSGALIQNSVAPVIRGSWIIFYFVPFLKSQQQLLLLTVGVGGGVNFLSKYHSVEINPAILRTIFFSNRR